MSFLEELSRSRYSEDFVDRSEHLWDSWNMARNVCRSLFASLEKPSVRCLKIRKSLRTCCRVILNVCKKMRSRVRKVCGARARTSWSNLQRRGLTLSSNTASGKNAGKRGGKFSVFLVEFSIWLRKLAIHLHFLSESRPWLGSREIF